MAKNSTKLVRVNQALVRNADKTGALADRFATAQLERWARLGRAIDAVISRESGAKLERLGRVENLNEIIAFSQMPEGREKAEKIILRSGVPTYETDSAFPALILQHTPDGTLRKGRFVNRQFVSADTTPRCSNRRKNAASASHRVGSSFPPPKGYTSWLHYAVDAVDTKRVYKDYQSGRQSQWPKRMKEWDFREAVQRELSWIRDVSSRIGPSGRLVEDSEATAFERVRLRSIGVEDDILAAEGGALSDSEFATRLNVRSRQTVHEYRKAGKIFAVKHKARNFVYPALQIHKKALLPGLVEVLGLLRASKHSPMGILLFFLTPAEALEDERPLDLLRRGELDEALLHAKRYGVVGS